MKSALISAVAAVALTSAASSNAAMLGYTGLEGQATGTLTNTVNDGTGFNPWSPQNTSAGYAIANTTPLTFGSLKTSAEGNYITGTGNFTTVGRGLLTGNGSVMANAGHVSDVFTAKKVDTGTVWFSFLARSDNASNFPTFFVHEDNVAHSIAGQGVKIGITGGTWSAALTSGTLAATSVTETQGQTTLLVGRYGFNGASSSFHFWAITNPASVTLGGADLGLGSATVAITGVASTSIDFKAFSANLANNGAANRAAWDEIRVGESFADVTPVVPEPGALVAAAASCGMLMLRRRH